MRGFPMPVCLIAALCTALVGGPALAGDLHLRFARVTLAEGRVEIDQTGTGEKIPAARNLPVGQGFWVETFGGAQAELEMDDGSYLRLGPDSQAELSDLAGLSTGQRISRISLERGGLYATAEPIRPNVFAVAAPGVEIAFLTGSRVRVEAGEKGSTVVILEGRVRLRTRAAELDLHEGETAHVDPQVGDRFQLLREAQGGVLDAWNEQRDREAAQRAAGTKIKVFPAGLGELDAAGKWIDAGPLGKVWRPNVATGWKPFSLGLWRWYDGLGYVWVSSESWGWLPYHYGRWTRLPSAGWVWAPGDDPAFKAGDTYWLRSAAFVGWGPLAPGENWRPGVPPALFSPANTTFALYAPGSSGAPHVIDPQPAPPLPPDSLKLSRFVGALPAPLRPVTSAIHRKRSLAGVASFAPAQVGTAARDAEMPHAGAGIQIIGGEPPRPPKAPQPPAAPSARYYEYPHGPPAGGVSQAPPGSSPGLTLQDDTEDDLGIYWPGLIVIQGGAGRSRSGMIRNGSRGASGNGRPAGGGAPAPAPPSNPAAPPAPGLTPPKVAAPTGPPGPERSMRYRIPESGEAESRRR